MTGQSAGSRELETTGPHAREAEPEMANITIRDVARAADVSPATVSRVLNTPDEVSGKLRSRVLAAVRDLGYRPNSQARSLRTRATAVLGVIISDVTNPFFTSMVRGVEDAASEVGYSVILANTDENLEKERRYLEVAVAERLAGVVLSPASAPQTRIDLLSQAGIPVVTIDRQLKTAVVDRVTIRNRKAAKEATLHLAAEGCRRIGFVGGPTIITTAADRLAGYRAGLKAAGIPYDPLLVTEGDYRIDGGREATRRLLALGARPDALLIANNLMTIGAIDAIDEAELRFPGDIALVGFDDMSWALGLHSSVTAVTQPTYDIGRIATKLLLQRVRDGADSPPRHVVLSATLNVRASSQIHAHPDASAPGHPGR
jgi:LacI family transcriptional regulator